MRWSPRRSPSRTRPASCPASWARAATASPPSSAMLETATVSATFHARLVPEIKVSDLTASLRFWCDGLGFRVLYGRPEEGFAYLDRDGAQIMLDQRGLGAPERRGNWETGVMERPFGRGVNFQVQASDLE